MSHSDLLRAQVKSLQDAVSSIYTEQADSEDEPSSESESEAFGPPGAEAGDGRRRMRGLSGVLVEGRDRVSSLLGRLQTQQRTDAIKSLATWFEELSPVMRREGQELDRLEEACVTERLGFDPNKEEATRLLESECIRSYVHLEDFHQHLLEDIGGGRALRAAEEQHQRLLAEFADTAPESQDEVQLEQAQQAVQHLQRELVSKPDPEGGLDQERLDELQEALTQRSERLRELQRDVDKNGLRTQRRPEAAGGARGQGR